MKFLCLNSLQKKIIIFAKRFGLRNFFDYFEVPCSINSSKKIIFRKKFPSKKKKLQIIHCLNSLKKKKKEHLNYYTIKSRGISVAKCK